MSFTCHQQCQHENAGFPKLLGRYKIRRKNEDTHDFIREWAMIVRFRVTKPPVTRSEIEIMFTI